MACPVKPHLAHILLMAFQPYVEGDVFMTETTISDYRPPQVREPVNVGEQERSLSALVGGALALYGLRRSPGGLLLAALGGALVYRGLTGKSLAYKALGLSSTSEGVLPSPQTVTVERAVTIQKPRAELFRYWRNFEQLPTFMQHLESVTTTGPAASHWVAKAPLGMKVEWDAEITEEREGEVIAWRATEDAQVPNAGRVEFKDAPGGRGTVVHVHVEYAPPGGALASLVALVTGEEPRKQVADDLRNFKALMETGEVPTTRGQPSGRGPEEPDPRTQTLLAQAAQRKENAR
jgi:uncharacterized membrane protein